MDPKWVSGKFCPDIQKKTFAKNIEMTILYLSPRHYMKSHKKAKIKLSKHEIRSSKNNQETTTRSRKIGISHLHKKAENTR